MKLIAEKNFKCNGVRKKSGESLSQDDISAFGDMLDSLKKDGFVGGRSEPKKESILDKKPELPAKKKVSKKVSKKL